MKGAVASAIAALALAAPAALASRLTPPVLPLVVRNPYLSTWLPDAREAPYNHWPMFWTGEEIGFSVLASVPENNNVYPLLGRPQDSLSQDADEGYNVSFPAYLGAQYDASVTNLTYMIPAPESAETDQGVRITLSFLSPITPTSTLRQSVPASYLSVHVQGKFDVDIYVDVNGQWVSGDRGAKITWDIREQAYENGKGLKTMRFRRETEQILTEFSDRSEWGTLHLSAPSDARHQIGVSSWVRRRFARRGSLNNDVDSNYRGIMDEEPIFAFSKSFSLDSDTSSGSVLFTLAHIQDPVVQYASARGLTLMKPLWSSHFQTNEELLTFHYFDYRNAAKLAGDYSEQLNKDAFSSGAEDYRDIVALSARQVMGATTFSGTPDNPILFLKEISSNGNFQTIDVIFPSFPFFLYTNPRWLAYLLEPLIEHMLSGQYPNDYAMHDLGTHFPNATGHPDGADEYMPVEECGNILIMGQAIVNSLLYSKDPSPGSPFVTNSFEDADFDSTDSVFPLTKLGQEGDIKYLDDSWGGSIKGEKQAQKWVKRSYPLWRQWTSYLVEFSLEPANQLSTDDFAGWLALQTNLALKGILGIKALSKIAEVGGMTADAKEHARIAHEYVRKWEKYALSRDGTHAKLAYDWFGSWTTIYNLFADSLLCFHLEGEDDTASRAAVHARGDSQRPLKPAPGQKNATGFVSSNVYKLQSDWYHYVLQKYGLPLDSRHLYTKSDWEFFAAAVTGRRTREEILQSVARWVNETETDRPFSDLYQTEGRGGFPGPNFFARPVVGGHFAFLALERACGGKAMDGLRFLDAEDVSATRASELEQASAFFTKKGAAPHGQHLKKHGSGHEKEL